MCDSFFKSSVLKIVSDEIFNNDLPWKVQGPLNKRYFY